LTKSKADKDVKGEGTKEGRKGGRKEGKERNHK